MLISFKVANFKSIRDEQELSMLPSKSDGDFEALPVAAIYGANASGKSTVLDALYTLEDVLSNSIFDETESGHFPFLLDEAGPQKPTSFELEIKVDGIRYEYAISSLHDRIEHEHLYSYPANRRRVLVERNQDRIKFGSTVKSRATLKKVAQDLNKNASVFRLAHTFSVEEFDPVMKWITLNLEPAIVENSPDALASMFEKFPILEEMIRIADVGIDRVDTASISSISRNLVKKIQSDIRFLEGEIASSNDRDEINFNKKVIEDRERFLQSQLKPRTEIVFYHSGANMPFRARNESRGTLAFLGYMLTILEALENGEILLVDEFDTSLHPRLIPRIIELFKDKETNPKNAQLVFTTHDATLLGTSFGDPILDRDEVWFVEKDESGATELFPLTSFKPRKEHNLERGYLGGSYGAVPEIFAQSLVDVIKQREGVASSAEADDSPR